MGKENGGKRKKDGEIRGQHTQERQGNLGSSQGLLTDSIYKVLFQNVLQESYNKFLLLLIIILLLIIQTSSVWRINAEGTSWNHVALHPFDTHTCPLQLFLLCLKWQTLDTRRVFPHTWTLEGSHAGKLPLRLMLVSGAKARTSVHIIGRGIPLSYVAMRSHTCHLFPTNTTKHPISWQPSGDLNPGCLQLLQPRHQ